MSELLARQMKFYTIEYPVKELADILQLRSAPNGKSLYAGIIDHDHIQIIATELKDGHMSEETRLVLNKQPVIDHISSKYGIVYKSCSLVEAPNKDKIIFRFKVEPSVGTPDSGRKTLKKSSGKDIKARKRKGTRRSKRAG